MTGEDQPKHVRRRVVTGHDTEGRAVVISNGRPPGRIDSMGWEELWAFDRVPARLADQAERVDRHMFRLTPEPGHIAVRIFTVRPLGSASPVDSDLVWQERMDFTETDERDSGSGPWMHRTPTVDIIVVIAGTMDLILEGGESVSLVAGDSVVQRGTMHAWRNTGTEPCISVAFMVRAE